MMNFYFDVISPYTYFAFQVLKRYRSIWKLKTCFFPMNLGAIMKQSHNTPPAMVPNRAIFINNDLTRNAKWYGLEGIWLGMPSNFFSAQVARTAILLNRILASLVARDDIPDDLKYAAVDTAFHILWEDPKYRSGSEFIETKPDDVTRDFLTRARISPSLIDLNNGKELLKTNTDNALSLNAFGSPIIQLPNYKEAIFFGSDRFEQIAFLLRLPWKGPNPGSQSKL